VYEESGRTVTLWKKKQETQGANEVPRRKRRVSKLISLYFLEYDFEITPEAFWPF